MSDVKMPWKREEFDRLKDHWDKVERNAIENRLRAKDPSRPKNFTEEEARALRAALDRLIPQQEGVDLVDFVDQYLHHPLGRGDRAPGVRPEADLIKIGLRALDMEGHSRHGRAFHELDGERQDAILQDAQEGKLDGDVWNQATSGPLPKELKVSQQFFEKLYSKALHGYFSDPRAWMRIGFMGASYPEGYRWLGKKHVRARRERHIGWDVM